MAKAEQKTKAQDALMYAMMTAFYAMADQNMSDELIAEAHKQVNRVEKLFGYTPGSWKS